MSISTNLISGLSSGFDWRSMIDQLIAIDHRRVDLVEDQKSDYEAKLEVYQSINTKLLSFKTQADALSKSDAFNVFTTSLSTDSSTYSASELLSVSSSSSAAPGSHTITMNSNSTLAQSRKISSKSFSSFDTALSLSGEFVINGRAVEVDTSDTLNDIQNKINNLNSGSNATGITATVLTVSSTNYRLILTSDDTGEDAFTIFDASADADDIISTGLGFIDSSVSVKNLLSNGVQSESFSSSSQSVQSMLGLTTAQNGSITIGKDGDADQISVTIDLSKSLTDIAGDINTVAGAASNISASVVSTTTDGVTTYRLKIENATQFGDATNNGDVDNVLQTLGFLEGGTSAVAEIHDGNVTNTASTANIAAITYWDQFDATLANGDTISFSGTNTIGETVTGNYTIDTGTGAPGDGDQVQALLTAIQTAYSTENPAYTVSASIVNGKIRITDTTTGDSQLSLTVTANNEGDDSDLDFGTISASTEGYTMQVQAGQDANININGTAITSSSNLIDDVITGVTINLLTVESGTTVNLSVSRDKDTIKSSIQGVLDQYNDAMTDINEQFAYNEDTETGGLLQGDGTLYSIKQNLVETVTSTISGLPSSLNALSLIGITSNDDGMLSIDDDDFDDAYNDDFNGLERIFIAEGSTTDGDVEYISHTNDTVAGDYAVNITQAATQASVTGSTALTTGIGATDIETLTISQSGKTGAIVLNGATGGNATSIDDIVNAINSELDTECAQSIMGNVKNTTDAGQTTAINNTTTWDSIFSGGVDAGLANGNTINFTGTKMNGTSVSGSYTIEDVATDTVQGLLSAIETAYDNEVSAAINTYGYLAVTDKTNGSSNLDITITEAGSLDFGDVTTSNLISSGRHVKTAGAGGGAIAIDTVWNDIEGSTIAAADTFKFSGFTLDGSAVEGSYSVTNPASDDVGDLLSAIKIAYDAAGANITAEVHDGRIVIKDGTTNSTLGIEIFEPDGKGIDFGTLSGGVTGRYTVDITASKDGSDQLVLTHDDYGSSASFTISQSGADLGLGAVTAGVDVAGTINGESATGSGQILTGDDPGSGTSSVEGLIIKYTGSTTGSQGNVKITMGVAELFDRILFDITDIGDGYLDFKIESVNERIDDLDDQIGEMEARLNLKMENMINRFVAMELALSQIQSQSNWLSGQLSAASSAWR